MAEKEKDIEIIIEIDGDVKGMQKQLDRMVRDSYNAKSAAIQREIIADLNDDTEGENAQMQWVAILDGDVCPECEDLDGEIFDPEDADAPPLHPNCRCVLSPVIDQQSLLDIITNLVEGIGRGLRGGGEEDD